MAISRIDELEASPREISSRRRLDSEASHWSRLKQALQRKDAAKAYILLLAWVRRAYDGMSLGDFQQRANDPQLNDQILAMSRATYGDGKTAPWDGQSAAELLAHHRKLTEAQKPQDTHLPPLNPA